VTPVLIAVVVAVAVVLLMSVLVVRRSRHDDEGERFRHVSDLTSAWSREQHSAPEQHGAPEAEGATGGRTKRRTTDSVDSR
jgi:hypothetical protein